MRPYRARFRGQGVFFAFQSWAGCITNIFGFDLRQAHPVHLDRSGLRAKKTSLVPLISGSFDLNQCDLAGRDHVLGWRRGAT